RSFGGGASRSDAILDVFDRFFGDNVDEEEYLKFVNQAKQDSERALAILEELIKRTQEQGKRRLEDLKAQEQTIRRQIELFRTVKDLTNEISRVSFNNFFGVTRTLNDQTIALAKIRGTASLFENSLSS